MFILDSQIRRRIYLVLTLVTNVAFAGYIILDFVVFMSVQYGIEEQVSGIPFNEL